MCNICSLVGGNADKQSREFGDSRKITQRLLLKGGKTSATDKFQIWKYFTNIIYIDPHLVSVTSCVLENVAMSPRVQLSHEAPLPPVHVCRPHSLNPRGCWTAWPLRSDLHALLHPWWSTNNRNKQLQQPNWYFALDDTKQNGSTYLPCNGHSVKHVPQDNSHHHFVS